MDREGFVTLALDRAPSPSFVVSEDLLKNNLEILRSVRERTGCKILLALKAFAFSGVFPLLREYLDGVCASGAHESRLGREEFEKEVHVSGPGYSESDVQEFLKTADVLTFNSFAQWKRFRPIVNASARKILCGLRINPEKSGAPVKLYDPCAPGSRLGIRRGQFDGESLDGVSGFHVHALCEQNSDALELVWAAVEEKFSEFLPRLEWLNLGGGHHITRPGYDIERLCRVLNAVRSRCPANLYLEPGEAVALGAGVLVATVLDVVQNVGNIAILDTSAETHMPDVLGMPYRPEIFGADLPGVLPHTYRLGGCTCLAGDIIGEYSFTRPLKPGDRLAFLDAAHYSMVKTTTFNGIPLPAIAVCRAGKKNIEVVREFGYEEYRRRLS